VTDADDRSLTDYERQVLRELHAWKHPPVTWRTRGADRLERMLEAGASALSPKLLDELFDRGLPILNRAARRSAPEPLVLAGYRRHGHPEVRSLADIAALSLEEVEHVVGTKRLAELVKGASEGGVTGFYGLAGLAIDIPALLALGLRSVNVFALSYGFDPSGDEERAYVLGVISASAAVGRDAKRVTRRALTIGQFAGKEITQRLLEHLPKELLVRVAAMSSSKAVPIAGAATGAAFNAWFLRSVAVHARFAYRERFLERRHGPLEELCL
jgi:EcsC family protein